LHHLCWSAAPSGDKPMMRINFRPARHFLAAVALSYLALAPATELCAQAVPIVPTPAKPFTLSVVVVGQVPGYDAKELSAYLADKMSAAGLSAWRFQADGANTDAPSRIEWRFRYNPYAEHSEHLAGLPAAMVDRVFGLRHVLSIEARLYINGQYQTLTFGQTKVKTNGKDAMLDGEVAQLANALLGPTGAYFAIDLVKPAH
jgi:hypothetical protein